MISIHPHKGYLNTEFHIHLTGENPISYDVFNSNNELILQGEAIPFKPQSIRFSSPGENIVRFVSGEEFHLFVEDGYRFGGSKIKGAFVFDDCPLAFVVMEDRTYFYNRVTDESYMEPISPDNVREVSREFVLFETKGRNEKLLYSLAEQRPIIEVSNIITYNQHVIIWKEDDPDINLGELFRLKIYSLSTLQLIYEGNINQYFVSSDKIYIIKDGALECLILESQLIRKNILRKATGKPIAVIDGRIAVTYLNEHAKKELLIYDVETEDLIDGIKIEGELAEVNDIELINVNKREYEIRRFNLEDSAYSESKITEEYTKVMLFPGDWKIFYTIKYTIISRSNKRTNVETTSFLRAVGSPLNIEIQNYRGKHIFNERNFCFYNDEESYVQGKEYAGSGYKSYGKVYVHKDMLILKNEDEIRELSPNGYWDNPIKGDFDFGYFNDYNIVFRNQIGYQYGLGAWELGLNFNHVRHPFEYCSFKDYDIYPGGNIFKKGLIPIYHSPKFNYGIQFEDNHIFLLKINKDEVNEKKQILEALYDTTSYGNVLLSEDGCQIIFRQGKRSTVFKYHTNETIEFECESYVQQINGLRPHFKIHNDAKETSRKVEIINPSNGKIINIEGLKDYVFISPDMKYYAETNLQSYEYYYDLLNEKEITKEEVNMLLKEFKWVEPYTAKNPENRIVLEQRKQFIRKNLDKLIKVVNEKGRENTNKETLENDFANVKSISANQNNFFSLLFELRGRVVIKSRDTPAIVECIELGPALWYLNYVAFSFDSRYVCIGGRYPNGSQYGGLFMIYDLKLHECLHKETDYYAIWTTAFNRDGKLAAYSSKPTLYYDLSISEYKNKPKEINHRSFLSFSADGKYIALSNKGYVAYNSRNGGKRVEWGHRETSDVFICKASNPEIQLIKFNDLSGLGVEGTSQNQSVASVSFSNDNKKFMMVGKDGVVIIRNLHLEDNAGE